MHCQRLYERTAPPPPQAGPRLTRKEHDKAHHLQAHEALPAQRQRS